MRQAFKTSRIAGEAADWARFAAVAVGSAAAFLVALLAFIVLADPYDTGRLTILPPRARQAISPRLDLASRGRDPAYDGAIVGNSHIAPISPTRLTDATGIRFASLIAAGGSVEPSAALLRWFLAHRVRPARAIVVGVDEVWCQEVPRYVAEVPFPDWLVSLNPWIYVRGLLRMDALEQAIGRIVTPQRTHFRPRPENGFWDLELDLSWDETRVRAALAAPGSATMNLSGRYPGLDRLRDVLTSAAVTPDTVLLLVLPPVWGGRVAAQDAAGAASDEACRSALTRFAAQRPRTVVIDWRRDRPETRAMTNFFDQTHYREPLARLVEAELADRLTALSKERP